MNTRVVPSDTWSKVYLTTACYFSYFVVGTIGAFITTLSMDVDGSDSMKHVHLAMSIKSGALTLGFILNGLVFDKINKRIGVIASLLLIPVTVVPVVLRETGFVLFLSQGLLGFVLSIFEVCTNSLMLDIWSGQVTSPSLMQKLHLLHDLGTFAAPFTANFILGRSFAYSDEPNFSFSKFAFFASTVAAPAIFSGLIHALLFLFELRTSKSVDKVLSTQPVASSFMYHIHTPSDQQNALAMTNIPVSPDVQAECQSGPQVTWKSFFASGLILFFFSGSNQAVFSYGPLVSNGPSDFATIARSHFMMNVSSSVAKILAGVACIFVSTHKLSIFSLFLALISLPPLYIFGNSSLIALQVGSVLFGCSYGVFPQLIISNMDQRQHLTTSSVGLLSFSKNAGSFGYSLLGLVLSKSITAHPGSVLSSLIATFVLLVLFLKKIR